MRLIILSVLLISCHSAANNTEKDLQNAIKSGDTALAKKLAQQELSRTRSEVTDSAFATLLDLNLQIQSLEFTLRSNDTVQMIADRVIVNGPGGQSLYNLAMKTYRLGLASATRHSDISLYTKELAYNKQEWLSINFAGKTNAEAKKSLAKMQRDAAIISAIVNGMDTDELRQQTEDSYKKIIE